MSLKEKISADMKEAMKARDQVKVDTLQAALSAFTYRRTESGADELSESEEIEVIQKQVKQRNDSINEYTKAGRTELADKELAERDILMKYMPEQKSEGEIREMIKKAITEMDGPKNQGTVMRAVMPQLKGMADGNLVRKIVTEELG